MATTNSPDVELDTQDIQLVDSAELELSTLRTEVVLYDATRVKAPARAPITVTAPVRQPWSSSTTRRAIAVAVGLLAGAVVIMLLDRLPSQQPPVAIVKPAAPTFIYVLPELTISGKLSRATSAEK